MQYLFNVQRTIGTNSTLELGYTGNQARKVAYLVNANAPVPGITTFDSREPYPEWHGIQFLKGDVIANYNALSGKLTQRFSAGLTTLLSYTWSKALDENSAIRGTGTDFTLENQRCRSCEYGPAGYNVPHRFVASLLYTLPFGKGQQFLNHGGVLNHRGMPQEWEPDSRTRIVCTASREWILLPTIRHRTGTSFVKHSATPWRASLEIAAATT